MNPVMAVQDEASIHNELLQQLREKYEQARRDPERIVRAEVDVYDLDAVDWLTAQPAGPRGYWSDRDEDFELAGIGRADAIFGKEPVDFEVLLQTLQRRVEQLDGKVRYFGGCCFDQHRPHDKVWEAFASYRFVLPRCEVLTRRGRTVFACNMRGDENLLDVEGEIRGVRFSADASPEESLPSCAVRMDLPNRETWLSDAADVVHEIKAGTFEKLVLARRATLAFDRQVSAAQLLRELKQNTSSSFHFCFQPKATQAFLGASPERLFRRDEKLVLSEAIAGTRVRGSSAKKDADLRDELLQSKKDLHEHQIVVDAILHRLEPMSRNVNASDRPDVLPLTHNQHLQTKIHANLNNGVYDADLLQALHPTPAVCGSPNKQAMEAIRSLEPFDRGWYAGPVGWVSRDASQFAVGIRSGLLDHHVLHLFSGAGIVQGSDPVTEWDELEHKLDDFLALFGASNR